MLIGLLVDWQQINKYSHQISLQIRRICFCIKHRIYRQSLLTCYVCRLIVEIEKESQTLFDSATNLLMLHASRLCHISGGSLPTSSDITDCVKFVAFLPLKIDSMLCLKSVSAGFDYQRESIYKFIIFY